MTTPIETARALIEAAEKAEVSKRAFWRPYDLAKGLLARDSIKPLAENYLALVEALKVLTDAAEEDYGIPGPADANDEAVALGTNGNSTTTFGMMRDARAALAAASGEEKI